MPLSIWNALVIYVAVAATAGLAADPNDWVNVDYVMNQAGFSTSGSTSAARGTIAKQAGSTAQQGPWTVVSDEGVKPPSGDFRDYLSWAPYHWPDCNWCSKGTNHFANPGGPDDGSGDDTSPNEGPPADNDPYENGGFDDVPNYSNDMLEVASIGQRSESLQARRSNFGPHRRMTRIRRQFSLHRSEGIHGNHGAMARRQPDYASPDPTATAADAPSPGDDVPVIPTQPPNVDVPQPPLANGGMQTTDRGYDGGQAPAQAPARTQDGGASCTPSPTKPLAPSATWTTCPYVARDGKVNPDVRTLPGPGAAVDMAQSVLYNAVTYAIQKTRTNSQNVANLIDTFFLSTSTGMQPNMNYGQQVRGPGKQHQFGTFTGILDMRGLVKVVNAIQLMRSSNSPDWTTAREQAMSNWMGEYLSWLQNSAIAKQTASKANNHLSFYVNQLAAAKMLVGDTNGATSAVREYFQNQFLDQIAASGEQPFEAVRTRPYHYRCFNLEAMITNAKLGDQLGLNLWTAKSKYGATIQTALDYIMTLDPKDEDISDVFAHIAAVAAAYGDPKGKYRSFLQSKMSNYQSAPFWFYDQVGALPKSPAASKQKRSVVEDGVGDAEASESILDATQGLPAVSFECPAVFKDAPKTELDNGVFVTCDDLRPLYETAAPLLA